MSVSRWGIVSTMLEWSRRLSLHGPQRPFGGTAQPRAPRPPHTSPYTYEMRAAGEADVPSIMEASACHKPQSPPRSLGRKAL
jgi:hypothetical protein